MPPRGNIDRVDLGDVPVVPGPCEAAVPLAHLVSHHRSPAHPSQRARQHAPARSAQPVDFSAQTVDGSEIEHGEEAHCQWRRACPESSAPAFHGATLSEAEQACRGARCADRQSALQSERPRCATATAEATDFEGAVTTVSRAIGLASPGPGRCAGPPNISPWVRALIPARSTGGPVQRVRGWVPRVPGSPRPRGGSCVRVATTMVVATRTTRPGDPAVFAGQRAQRGPGSWPAMELVGRAAGRGRGGPGRSCGDGADQGPASTRAGAGPEARFGRRWSPGRDRGGPGAQELLLRGEGGVFA